MSDNVKRTLLGAFNMSIAGDQAIGELRTMTQLHNHVVHVSSALVRHLNHQWVLYIRTKHVEWRRIDLGKKCETSRVDMLVWKACLSARRGSIYKPINQCMINYSLSGHQCVLQDYFRTKINIITGVVEASSDLKWESVLEIIVETVFSLRRSALACECGSAAAI